MKSEISLLPICPHCKEMAPPLIANFKDQKSIHWTCGGCGEIYIVDLTIQYLYITKKIE